MALEGVDAPHQAHGLRLMATQQRPGLREDPRVAIASPRDHDCRDPGLGEHAGRLAGVSHVSGTNDRHVNGLDDPAHHVPVRLAVVELRGIAAMHGHGPRAGVCHAAGELRRDLGAVAPAAADLYRHGHVDGARAGCHQGSRKLGRLHERRALTLLGDLGHGAGHVDVDEDEPLAQALGHAGRGLGKKLGLGAKELDGEVGLPGSHVNELPGLLAAVVQARARDHLGVGEVCPAGPGHHAVRRVRHAGHGRHEQRVLGKSLGKREARTAARKGRKLPAKADARAKGDQDVGWGLHLRGRHHSSSTLSTARNASCGTSTLPICFMRFLPSFCFSSSLRLREMSPP